jgi:hypothetical protein
MAELIELAPSDLDLIAGGNRGSVNIGNGNGNGNVGSGNGNGNGSIGVNGNGNGNLSPVVAVWSFNSFG